MKKSVKTDKAVIPVWQCIGCGRIELPQICIGVCRDEKRYLVSAHALDASVAENERLRRVLGEVCSRLQRFAHARPRENRWEAAFLSLQAEVAALIDQVESARAEP
ncbi:hypothetical protein [Tahibacter amnicola]|uniref:Uncharacterized protein n=1 Tax=Tahibacter amnicola TaxID=2976241 RepID=A0ABY6BL30_9GAMM|nr:hypothetical protein [Tahibacter amnicola]UXI70487.1 hypothetical protein N4264_12870 [Tahibacter amnicola]